MKRKWKSQFDIGENRPGTKFGKAKFLKRGVETDVQDFINSQNEDIEIYPTLEKYGGEMRPNGIEKKEIASDGVKRAKDEILNPVINQEAAKALKGRIKFKDEQKGKTEDKKPDEKGTKDESNT